MTFARGTGGGAAEKASYYAEPTLPDGMAERAAYYLRGVSRGDLLHTAAVPRADMTPEMAQVLGLDPTRGATLGEVANLIAGRQADGAALPGNQRAAQYADRQHVTYYDFTLSAPKSVSVAFALAPTEAERALILTAHEEATSVAMGYLEERIARVRRGHAGAYGTDRGVFGYVSFLHVSSRPTVSIAHRDPDGTPATIPATVPGSDDVPGDMGLHTHHIVPNAVRLPDGTVGSMDTLGLHDFVHEAGGVYQFTLGTRLRAQGVPYRMDPRTELGRIPTVSPEFCEAMSKRTRRGEDVAREFAKARGQDWDRLDALARRDLLREGVQGKGQRRPKVGEAWADASWRAQARQHGYEHRSVVDSAKRGEDTTPPEVRHRRAWEVALPMLERRFGKRAVLSASVARVVVAHALIETGAESPADMDAVTRLMREHGVSHDGKRTALVWAEAPDVDAARLASVRGGLRITTRAHLDQETEALSLIAEAAGDRSGALRADQVEAALAQVVERDGLDFDTEAGREQRRIIDAIAYGGRFVAVIGGAGVGKSTLMRVPVEAWRAEGREVFAVALAWRQAMPLTEAGIPAANAMALDKLLHGAADGRILLGSRSVVVVDELGQVGTKQQLALARLQARHGFTLVSAGDDEQGQPVAHGNPYALIRRAIGAERVPEITATVRQLRERDRETTLLFRSGRGAEAVARLREDGTTHLVPGGYAEAVAATADLWDERTQANARRAGYSLSISTPTNREARDISMAIRERRRARGDLAPDTHVEREAQDQNGTTFELRLAPGDRVRLFDLVRARTEGLPGAPIFGTNGSVVTVERFTPDGFEARNAGGTLGLVTWDTLRDKATGRVRLTYGDAVSIDAIQSTTSTESIAAFPDGTRGVHSKRSYVSHSRSREATFLVVSDGAERQAIGERRPIGDARPVTAEDVWSHVGTEFSRRVTKELAVEMLERAHRFRVGTVRDFAPSMREAEAREAAGKPPGTAAEERRDARDAQDVAEVASALAAAVRARGEAVKRLTGPRQGEREAQRARRTMRSASQRPKQETAPVRKPVSATEAEAEFREALRRAGLRPKGPVHMDGRPRYTEVEGSRSKRGFYVAHLDGAWPAGTIINHRTRVRVDWSASRDERTLTPEQEAAERQRRLEATAQQAAAQARRDREQREAQEAVGRVAEALWQGAAPATAGHPYLVRKGVSGDGWRVGVRGQSVTIQTDDGRQRRASVAGSLMVPMQDADGRLWGVQTIRPDGTKLYTGGMKGQRKQGTFAVLGEMKPGEPRIIVEGAATARTVHDRTGVAVVIVFDGSNILPVARALRERDPVAPMGFGADNDHHLPHRMDGQGRPLANVGVEKATAAAAEVGGFVMLPPPIPERLGSGEAGTDYNDFEARFGKVATEAELRTALGRVGVRVPGPPPVRGGALPVDETMQARRDTARQRTGDNPHQRSDAAEQSRRAQQSTRGAGHAPSP